MIRPSEQIERQLEEATTRTKTRSVIRLALLLAILGGAEKAFPQQSAQPGAAAHEYHLTPNVMVSARDGVGLATDIYRPARNGQPLDGKWPAVLFRIPYGKRQPGTVTEGQFFARHGYVYVAQDSRGRFDSQGTFTPFGPQEGPDGFDAVTWITKQPWSNGKVATIGVSYGALTQLQLGGENPPGLVAQYMTEMGPSAFTTGMYIGGAFHMRRIAWILRHAVNEPSAAKNPFVKRALEQMHRDLPDYYERFPLAFRAGATPLALVPNFERLLTSILEHPAYGPFWNQSGFGVAETWDRYADVPIYWHGAWYDIYSARTPGQYATAVQSKKSPQRLIMGPWTHGATNTSFAGDVEFGPDAAVDPNYQALKWFDQVVKGISTGVLTEPPVRLFVMGGGDGHRTAEGRIFHGGQWRFENDWPLKRAENTEFYFQPDGSLARLPVKTRPAPTMYVHDPFHPVPTRGGVDPYTYKGREFLGGYDQREGIREGLPLRLRPDVVVFQTAPLEQDVEVTGPIAVTLFASSSAVNTDFTVKFVDVYPPSADWPEGFDLNLSDGILRATHRESLTNPTPLEPGKVYQFTIEVPPVANLFKRGHRIRIDIASSNFPRFDVNPGTVDPPWERRTVVRAENRLYHDAEHASRVTLPIIPRK